MPTRIHVVAGDAHTSGRLAEALREAGHQVTSAESGTGDLLGGIVAAAPDVVLLAPAADNPADAAALADGIRAQLGLPIVWYGPAGRPGTSHPPGSLHPFAVVPESADPRAAGPALEGALKTLALARRVARAEQSLRESEQRQHAILDHIPDPAWLKDREGRYLAANRAWREFFGMAPDELVGRTDHELLPDGLADKLAEEDRYLVETGATTRIESQAIDVEGNVRWFETVKAPVHNASGQLTGIVGIARDITRRQQMEDALRLRAQGEGLLAQITARFFNLPVAEIDGGLDTALRETGALFKVDRMYLIPHDPLLPSTGQSHEWCAPGVPAPGGRGLELRATAGGSWDARLRALELVIINRPADLPDPSPERSCLARLGIQSLLLLPIAIRGRLIGVLGLEQIGSPRAWSAEVVALTRLLAQVIANALERKRLEQDRERLLAELNRKHAELEHLVYVTSHDLRTPMLNIQGFAMRLDESCRELNRLTAAASLPPADHQALQLLVTDRMPGAVNYVLTSIDRMDRLIEALLRLSRLGRAELQYGRIDVDALVTGILDTVAFRLQETGADVEVHPLPPCHGDAGQIGQLFSNLIDNAIKYRDPQRPLRLSLEGHSGEGFVTYRVSDNGLGIAPEHREKIWQVFFRANPRGTVPGDGIGLNLARRIAERHGGEISVESTPGLGSCFQVRLPLPTAPAAPAAALP